MNWILSFFKKINLLKIDKTKKSFIKKLNFQNKPIKYLLNDPTTNMIVDVPIPQNPQLSIFVQGYSGGGYDIDSPQGQAAICYVTLCNSIQYMISKCNPKKPIQQWALVKNLSVFPRAGKNLNAYYDRSSLRFFYDKNPKTQKIVYLSQSSDVVAHEFGHAFLDILRPELYNQQAYEVWAFHEAFGDIAAILNIMQWDQVLEKALNDTNKDLSKSNIISKIAEEIGQTVYQINGNKNGNLTDTLRDAVNDYKYVDPTKLKDKTLDNVLSRESHNFSRVLTGAWYEIMIRMYQQNVKEGIQAKNALIQARDTAATYFLHASLYADTIYFFDAIAKQMLHYDNVLNKSKYQDVMLEVFQNRNILKPRLLLLNSISIEEILPLSHTIEIDAIDNKIIKVGKTQKVKFSDFSEIGALSQNPLYNVDVEIPNESVYIFDKNNNLVNLIESSKEEIIDSLYWCLHHLENNNLIGTDEDQPFEIQDNTLKRKYFSCKCNLNNACDPNAPEYGKRWKGENNAGCYGCKGATRTCECQSAPIVQPPKYGCYTTINKYGIAGYKIGSTASRRVC